MFKKLRDKVSNLRKHKGVDGIIVCLFLCVIAVVLCAIFKDQIGAFMKTVMTALTGKAESIINTTSVTAP